MASPFDRIMDTIRPHLPGAVDNAIRQELFLVCDEFFKRSDAWREEIPFVLQAGKKTAEVMPFAGRIERLLFVKNTDGLGVRGATMPNTTDGLIAMPYAAQDNVNYSATVSLTVSDPVTRDAYPIIPYDIVQKFTAEFKDGILAAMMAQPSKPYTNITMAQVYMIKFRSGAARAKNATNTENTEGSQRWAFPQTFNRR